MLTFPMFILVAIALGVVLVAIINVICEGELQVRPAASTTSPVIVRIGERYREIHTMSADGCLYVETVSGPDGPTSSATGLWDILNAKH